MKTSILFFVLVLSSFTLKVQYQKPYSLENHAIREVNSLKLTLKLTDQQTEKVKQIYINHYNSTDSLKSIIVKQGPTQQAVNANLTTMFSAKQLETDKKISAVLNDDQQRAFAKHLSHRRPGFMISVATPAP